ncbi:MAG: PQQ-binding-like beta-propeller repeat protein [Planctomycetota bacterium]
MSNHHPRPSPGPQLPRLSLSLALLGLAACSQTEAPPENRDRPWQPPSRRAAGDLVWGQWRGAARDGHAPDRDLAAAWPAAGPKLAWKATGLGPGFASVAFAGNRAFTMGDTGGAARLYALDLADGAVVWHARVGAAGGNRNPGPRSTPATDGELVFGLGHDGELVCVAAADGAERWRCNLVDDYSGRMMSQWDFSESPLLDGDLLVCCPGGSDGTVLALRKTTGEVAWRCTELTDAASYASVIVAEIGGVRQYLVLTGQTVAGVDAANGALLWRAGFPGQTAVCATPVYEDGWLFVTAGYGVGCAAYRITANDGTFAVEQAYAGKQLQNHHGGVVLVDGHVYGVGRRNLKCLELRTGKVLWEEKSVGKGSVCYADGHLVVRSERGPLAWVAAQPTGYAEHGRFDQPDRSEEPSWAYPAVHEGRLYVRDGAVLLAYELR